MEKTQDNQWSENESWQGSTRLIFAVHKHLKPTVSPDGNQSAIAFAEELLALEHLPRIKSREPMRSYLSYY